MKKKKIIYKLIFALYLALLMIFVIIKFNGHIDLLFDRMNHFKEAVSKGANNYNLIPFLSIRNYLRGFPDVPILTPTYIFSSSSQNIFGNIIAFIPFGYLLPLCYRSVRLLKLLFIGFISILAIELFQYYTFIGSFDIDDIILNSFGCLIGYIIFRFHHLLHKKLKHTTPEHIND